MPHQHNQRVLWDLLGGEINSRLLFWHPRIPQYSATAISELLSGYTEDISEGTVTANTMHQEDNADVNMEREQTHGFGATA